MLPFKIAAVVLCDDVRVEQSNKHILIGVYNNAIVVNGFPAEIPVCWWIQILPERIGHFDMELQLVKDDKSTLLKAIFAFDAHATIWSAITLPKATLQLHGPGTLRLEMKNSADTEWTTIHEFNVAQGNVVGAATELKMA